MPVPSGVVGCTLVHVLVMHIRQWDRNLSLSLAQCVFLGNGAGASTEGPTPGAHPATSIGGLGGAVFLAAGGDVLVQDVALEGNAATTSGGGT